MKTINVIMGPTFSGKTTLIKQIINRNPDVKRLITHTTRPKREGEVDGRDYYFVSDDQAAKDQLTGQAIAPRTYHVQSGDYWTYYVSAKTLKNLPAQENLIITDLTGYHDIKDYVQHAGLDLKVKGWIINTDLMTIFKRIVNSNRNHENPKETLRRLYDDEFNVFNNTADEYQKAGITLASGKEILQHFN